MNKRELLDSLVDDGFLAYMGFRLVEWDIDYAVMEFTVGSQHLNRHQIIHGGVLTSIIDSVAGFAGLYGDSGQLLRAVTVSLTTSFTGKASSGTIRAVGRKKTGGKTTFVSTVEVMDENEKRIALGQATYLYLKD